MLLTAVFAAFLALASAQCDLKNAIVANGVVIFENTDLTSQFDLSMKTVPSGQTAYVMCDRGYQDSTSSNTYVANACSGTAWATTVTCAKDKKKYGMKRRDARNVCSNKWATSMSQRCGYFDTSTELVTNGPCDARTDNQCPFFKNRVANKKNYNFCSCLPAVITN